MCSCSRSLAGHTIAYHPIDNTRPWASALVDRGACDCDRSGVYAVRVDVNLLLFRCICLTGAVQSSSPTAAEANGSMVSRTGLGSAGGVGTLDVSERDVEANRQYNMRIDLSNEGGLSASVGGKGSLFSDEDVRSVLSGSDWHS